MYRVFIALVLLLLVSFPATSQAEELPRFEPGDCPFNVGGLSVSCGHVVVAADRADETAGTLRIAVARFAGDRTQTDPLIVLSGGPGEKTVENAPLFFTLMTGFADGRDLIVFDQRGVGLSEPALDCPEWIETMLELLSEPPDTNVMLERTYTALMACADRLSREVGDLSVFNSIENAADVADLARVLGYEQVNLLGVSYGSLLAQHVMRDHPEIVRAAILDSVLPLEGSFFVDTYDTAPAALERLFAACAADADCDSAYPDLREVLFAVIDELNADPVPLSVIDPTTGIAYDMFLNGDAVVNTLVFFLYQAPIIGLLPKAVYDVAAGDYALMQQLNGAIIPSYGALSRGMFLSVMCAEDLIGRTPADLIARWEALEPRYRGSADLEAVLEYATFGLCESWPVPQLAAEVKNPLVSDLPTLLLAGEFDPVTPTGYAEQVAASLSAGYLFELPAIGHSVIISSECAQSIASAFLADPTVEPDSACIAELGTINFALPAGDFALTTFVDEELGIAGLIPEGWSQLAPGTYAETMVSNDAIVQAAVPDSPQAVIDQLSGQLGIAVFPEAVAVREGADNGFMWSLYELTVAGALLGDLAIAQTDAGTVFILLISTQDSRPALYDAAFLPAVDALQYLD
jgi:pimeloyl-ACP methyl ester carboxylesterase